jgi:hypothetical protein
MHMDVRVATDFFTTEVWTRCGLVTYYMLFFLHLGSHRVHIAGLTPHPMKRGWCKWRVMSPWMCGASLLRGSI